MAGRPLRRARLEAEARANGEMLPARRDYRAEMTAKLVEQLQAGTAPWQKTWTAGSGGRPYNPLSADPQTASGQRGYSGINRIVLMVEGAAYGDDRWCTRKQAEEKGYTLRPGMTGTTIEVWKPYVPKAAERNDQDPQERDDRSRMGVRFYTVFNAAQFSDFPALERIEREWTPIERAEQILAGSGAKIVLSASEDTPHYAPGRDHIVLPTPERFINAEAYYDTATHELVHWTGHESRLNRFEPDARFGTPSYAREELIAEIGSMFLSADTGIAHNTEQHAAYVSSWIALLESDKNAVARAAGGASKAVDLVLALERDRSAAKMHIAEQSVPAVLAARGLPGGISALLRSSEEERHRYDGLDGAYIIQCPGDRRIETWGDEHPVLAIRQGNNDGISLRLEQRNETWKAIQSAVAGHERIEITLDGFVRDANEVERRTSLVVVVGRTNGGRILLSMHPLAEPDRTMQVRLSRESADYFARAMEVTDYRQRKLLVFEALHEDMEITNALAR